jgi:hypothetical protein
VSSGRKPPTPENAWIKWLYDRKVNFGLKKAFGIFAVILSAATRRVWIAAWRQSWSTPRLCG